MINGKTPNDELSRAATKHGRKNRTLIGIGLSVLLDIFLLTF